MHARAGCGDPRAPGRAGRGGHGRRPAQHEPRRLRGPPHAAGEHPRRRQDRRVARSACWPTCRARRSGSAGSRTARRTSRSGRGSPSRSTRCQGTVDRCGTTYKGLPGDVSPGDLILIDDGKLTLRAVEVTATDVVTEVVVGGPVSNNKGINLPGVAMSVPGDEREGLRGPALGARARASTWSRCPSCAAPRTSSSSTRSWTRRAAGSPSSPRSRSRRPSRTSTRSSTPSTRSWSRAATSAWSCRWRRCRSSRSRSSARPAAGPSRSSSPRRCSSR